MSDIMLRCGKTTAKVQLRGAQLSSFRGNDGREVIWQADPAFWEDHAPVLFPVCGTAKNDQVVIGGVTYPMEKHGFTVTADFCVEKQGDDFVELLLTPTEESRRMYPFDFALHVTYTLVENGYKAVYVVENKSDRVMPFCIGGHPSFTIPMEDGASFDDYQLVFECPEEGKNMLCPDGGLVDGHEFLMLEEGRILPLRRKDFVEQDSLIFPEFRSRMVDLVHRTSGRGVRIRYPKMEAMIIWAMPDEGADFICIEPWHGMPGSPAESGRFEDKMFVTMLAPGMSHQCGFEVELI